MMPATNQLLQAVEALLQHASSHAACAEDAAQGCGHYDGMQSQRAAALHAETAAACRAVADLLGALSHPPVTLLRAEGGALAARLRAQADESRRRAAQSPDGWMARLLAGAADTARADAMTVDALVARLLLADAEAAQAEPRQAMAALALALVEPVT